MERWAGCAISARSRLVAKNAAARPAVARVRKFGRAATRHEAATATPATDAQRTAFRALQQHHADQGQREHDVNDEQNGGHASL